MHLAKIKPVFFSVPPRLYITGQSNKPPLMPLPPDPRGLLLIDRYITIYLNLNTLFSVKLMDFIIDLFLLLCIMYLLLLFFKYITYKYIVVDRFLCYICLKHVCSSTLSEIFLKLSLIHIWRCRRLLTCRSRWSPYH